MAHPGGKSLTEWELRGQDGWVVVGRTVAGC